MNNNEYGLHIPNIEQQINRLLALADTLRYALAGPSGTRPPNDPFNHIAYDAWFLGLTPEQKDAEQELKRKGWYNYEGDDAMLVLDKNGKDIHTEDIVEWNGVQCVVVCILSESELQVNPIGEGLPELVKPDTVEVKSSFIDKLRSLRTNEELLAIIQAAERRLASSRASSETQGPRKVSAPKKQTIEIEL